MRIGLVWSHEFLRSQEWLPTHEISEEQFIHVFEDMVLLRGSLQSRHWTSKEWKRRRTRATSSAYLFGSKPPVTVSGTYIVKKPSERSYCLTETHFGKVYMRERNCGNSTVAIFKCGLTVHRTMPSEVDAPFRAQILRRSRSTNIALLWNRRLPC